LVLRLTGPLSREPDDQVGGGNNSFKLGSGRSVTTVRSATGSRGTGAGATGIGVGGSSRLVSFLPVRGRAGALCPLGTGGESFLATIVGARVGRVGAALGIRVGSVSRFSGAGRIVTGMASCGEGEVITERPG